MNGLLPNQRPGYLVEGAPDHAHAHATNKETGVFFKAIKSFMKAPKTKGIKTRKPKLPQGHGKNIIRSSTIVTHPYQP